MGEKHDKAQAIRKTIESTIENAIDIQTKLEQATDYKEQQRLLSQNEGRAQAIPSLIRDLKEAEAAQEIGLELGDAHHE